MNSAKKLAPKITFILITLLMLTTTVWAVGGGGLWLNAGHDRNNTRFQKTESKIGPENVADLTARWVVTTGGDVSATPAVDGEAVYFPDWAGNLFKLDRATGATIWQKSFSDYTGIPGNFARATPAVYEGRLYIGDQGGRLGASTRMMAIDATTGNLIWSTNLTADPFAMVTQSATVFDGIVYVGIASFEEILAAFIPGYECCTSQGQMFALDADTGEILWITTMVPAGYSGSAVWGSSPVVDTKRGSVYIATGNNYSVPQSYLDCIAAAGDDETAQFACLDPGNLFDSVVALDMNTGAIKWSAVVIPFDTWTLACLLDPFNTGNCPDPEGPDFDFGQAPILYRDPDSKMDMLGVGQKSGQFWALNPDNGQVIWSTQVGPGGELGGIMWGSAHDGERIYTAVANSQAQEWTLIDGTTTIGGFWSALDPATGEILWQTADPNGNLTMGAVSTANGVVYACSMDPQGHMYALDGATGDILWSFASGGSCNAGAAIVNGTVFWGSGYASLGLPGNTGNDKFYAFTLP